MTVDLFILLSLNYYFINLRLKPFPNIRDYHFMGMAVPRFLNLFVGFYFFLYLLLTIIIL